MFAIAVNPRPYPTYRLSDDESQAELEVVPERGGIITRWRIQGQDILYLDEERFAQPELSVRGGIPILFPICGNLPNNRFDYHGKSYPLKQHGFARDLPWAVVDQTTDKSASLTIELTSTDQTRQVYPFDFRLCFSYQLQGYALRIQQAIENLSGEPMPFSLGFHPYFQVLDKSQLSFQIPSSEYIDQKTGLIHPFSGEFDWNIPEIDAAFTAITRHSAKIIDANRSREIALSYSHLFSTVVFWTILGKDYVCLEPWSAPRNAINTGDKLTILAPKERYEAVFELRVTPLP